jgi:hypothetical protein
MDDISSIYPDIMKGGYIEYERKNKMELKEGYKIIRKYRFIENLELLENLGFKKQKTTTSWLQYYTNGSIKVFTGKLNFLDGTSKDIMKKQNDFLNKSLPYCKEGFIEFVNDDLNLEDKFNLIIPFYQLGLIDLKEVKVFFPFFNIKNDWDEKTFNKFINVKIDPLENIIDKYKYLQKTGLNYLSIVSHDIDQTKYGLDTAKELKKLCEEEIK